MIFVIVDAIVALAVLLNNRDRKLKVILCVCVKNRIIPDMSKYMLEHFKPVVFQFSSVQSLSCVRLFATP